MCSAMLLSDGSSLPSRDTFAVGEARQCLLTAREIMATAVAPPHTTLQACSLGRHTRGARDELWGMTRAILAGGGSSVIAPHWDVDMNSSTQLLASFYRKWLSDGMSKPCAFTHAQRQLSQSIEKSEWTHFYHWGAFQYFGW